MNFKRRITKSGSFSAIDVRINDRSVTLIMNKNILEDKKYYHYHIQMHQIHYSVYVLNTGLNIIIFQVKD